MKKSLLSLAAVALVLGVGVPAYAQQPKPGAPKVSPAPPADHTKHKGKQKAPSEPTAAEHQRHQKDKAHDHSKMKPKYP